MTTLAALQNRFFSALIGEADVVEADFIASPSLTVQQKVAIYRNSSIASLVKILRGTYPVCCKIVGEEFFNAMAEIYVRQTPSRCANIKDYGATFNLFIEEFPHTQPLPYLASVASLEWACSRASESADYNPLNVQMLAQVPSEHYPQIIFQLPPGSTLLSSSYSIKQIWEFNQDDYQGADTINLTEVGEKLFIWRQGVNLHIDALQEQEWQLLTAIKNQLTVAELCNCFGTYAPKQLTKFMQRGWVAGFEKITS